MLPSKSFVCFLLVILSSGFAHAADTLHESVFLVGPKPLPVEFGADTSGLDRDGVPNDAIHLPLPSISLPGGGRKRNLRRAQLSAADSKNSRRNYMWKPDSAPLSHLSLPNHTASLEPRSLQNDVCSVTNTILSFQFDDNLAETGGYLVPPAPSGSCGMSRLVAVVNAMIEVRQKDGALLFRDGLSSFFSASLAATEVGTRFFDPKVIYDEHKGRFVLVVLQVGESPPVSRIWMAVSKTETPDAVSDWYKVYVDALETVGGNSLWADYTGLEVDEEAVYITVNMYRFLDNGYVGTRLWWFSKGVGDGFYAGKGFNPLFVNPFGSVGIASTTMPAQVHGAGGADGAVGTFFTTVIPYLNGRIDLQIYTLFNPLGASPTYTLQSVSLGVIDQGGVELPMAPQFGTNEKIATVDARVLDAVWRDSQLWVVFTVNPPNGINQGQATAHWVRMSTTGGSIVTIEAQGSLGGEGIAAGTSTYFPSVAVNSRGLVAYGYSASSSTKYAGAYASLGTSEASYTVQNGLGPYVRKYGGGKNQWGLYSSISVDPVDGSFWVLNQYASTVGSVDSGGDGRWGTAWGRLACSAAPTPTPLPPPTLAPIPAPCGLFGWSLFCPLTLCGMFGRALDLCRS